ncbi:uncharacterized protein LOC110273581 [Arachis duranensis]|uniref:Uncharacterized protein LOC110273581 n=1 Tax=Arachis duranensis TaxID=130453 RepID=A0A6P5MB69_ARADU|nr:uncharacterized protein LOC110273581 [Arachis duranensis]
MPFGLKNAGATYQRLMNKIFADHIEKLMEVYVGDMLVKTQKEETLLPDLAEVFGTIGKHEMRLNPTKCTFAVEAGIDYFTKWIEAEPLAAATTQRSRMFLYRNIVTRFGVLHSITTDNGTQFTDIGFRNLVADLKIKHQFTSVEHPQGNR